MIWLLRTQPPLGLLCFLWRVPGSNFYRFHWLKQMNLAQYQTKISAHVLHFSRFNLISEQNYHQFAKEMRKRDFLRTPICNPHSFGEKNHIYDKPIQPEYAEYCRMLPKIHKNQFFPPICTGPISFSSIFVASIPKRWHKLLVDCKGNRFTCSGNVTFFT